MKTLDILIIIPPPQYGKDSKAPYGAMYVASALKKDGYHVKLLQAKKGKNAYESVENEIRTCNPRYLGFSSLVATSYQYVKQLSKKLKAAFPDKLQILGGTLSYVPEAILHYTDVDIIVHGEGEITATQLLRRLDRKENLSSVRGIFYKGDSGITYTGKGEFVRNMDSLSYPAFDMVNVENFITDVPEFVRNFPSYKKYLPLLKNKGNGRMLDIIVNRGCVGSCTFCTASDRGFRMPSIGYLLDYVEFCVKQFNLGYISFIDECFAPSRARNWEFINEFRKRKLNIGFRIVGLRVDTVDRDILKAFRDIGCFMINYGFESGSQKMLNIIDKRIHVADNKNVTMWTHDVGIYSPIQLIIGMPGETSETIEDTIKTLKSMNLDFNHYKSTYALPLPGSCIYEYAKITGIIKDDAEYLEMLAGIDGTQSFHVNLTDESDAIVKTWKNRITLEMKNHYISNKYKTRKPFMVALYGVLEALKYHIRMKDLHGVARRKISIILSSIFKSNSEKEDPSKKQVTLQKTRNIKIEDYINPGDGTYLNRTLSLRNLIKKINAVPADKK